MPRFKHSLATIYPADEDVLEIKLTGFGNVQEPLVTEIKESLKRDYNITMGKLVDSTSVYLGQRLGWNHNNEITVEWFLYDFCLRQLYRLRRIHAQPW